MMWLIVVGWLICGILAYGIMKDALRHHNLKLYREEDLLDEAIMIFLSVMGPISLFSVLLESWIEMRKPGLCYRMPKELCEPKGAKR